MVKQKAIISTRADFEAGREDRFETNPFIYFDGENLPKDIPLVDTGIIQEVRWMNGSPTPVDGIVGKANKFHGESLQWRNWGLPSFDRLSLSLWVKFSQADLSGWKILATHRFDGWTSRLLHVASLDGQLNVRLYGAGDSSNSLSLFTSGSNGTKSFNFEPNVWYNVSVIVDTNQPTDKLVVIVNGDPKIKANFSFGFNMTFKNSFVVGDMYDGNGYPLNGTIIDEVIYAIHEDAWTQEDAIRYYEEIANGESLDYATEEGTLRLSKGLSGAYPTKTVSWTSNSIGLGGKGFVDFGLIQAKGIVPAGTSLSFYTRTSANGIDWNEWVDVGEDGKVKSENLQFIQVRVDFKSDGTDTPVLEEIQILEDVLPPPVIELPNTTIPPHVPLYLYRDLATGRSSLGELKHAYDIVIEEEINGEDILTFKLPLNDKKRKEVGDEPVELVAEIAGRYYIVKEVIDKRDGKGAPYTEFVAEAIWTELRDWYVDGIEVVGVTARHALETIFSNIFREEGDPEFDWKLGNVEITKRRTLRKEWSDVLSLIREVQKTWGGEILFDLKTKTVHLLKKIGKDAGVRFMYEKNLKEIERVIHTYDLVTRIYPTGKGGLDIRTVNNGVPYLEDLTWVNRLNLRRKVIPYRWKDERYTIPENLKEDAQTMLDELAKPKVSYTMKIADLSALTGHEHESFEMGDTVTAIDNELFGVEIVNRIVRRQLDIRKPENTVVELAQPVKTLADIQSRAVDDQISNLIASDPLSTTDAQQMTVFNNLLNSRFEDGMKTWVHETDGSKFELANAGFSGTWSVKVTPEFNSRATLTQTVEGVSHRSSYTISAAVATEGKIVRGSADDAFVGIKVLVYYEGETKPEEHFLAIPDITTEDEGDS